MLRSWKLGHAFGIPLYINPTFLLLPIVMLYANRDIGPFGSLFFLLVMLTVFACVVLHELGHALMARYFGIGTKSITLYPVGGVALLDRMSERPHEELCIALAGPAVNVVITALLTPVLVWSYATGNLAGNIQLASFTDAPTALLAKFAFWIWESNLFLVLFNMLPAFPMDGGRVLRAILASVLGQLRATEIAGSVGVVIAMLLCILAVFTSNPMLVLVSLFVIFVGYQERVAVRYREAQRAYLTHPARPAAGPMPATATGFSGVAWDGNRRLWIHWQNGTPVGYWAPAE